MSTAQAVTYVESGDAGQTLATAANTGLTAGGTGTLTGISGTIGTVADADLYLFTVGSLGTASQYLQITAFGGTSSVSGNGPIDTSLFLLNSSGQAVIANDDQSNTSYQGQLNLVGLAAGTYYLGISLSGNEPVNSVSQLLFTTDQPTTAVRTAASGLNPTTESTFNGQTYVAETGPYSIGFAVVPEPSTWTTLALGTGTLALFLRRRRNA